MSWPVLSLPRIVQATSSVISVTRRAVDPIVAQWLFEETGVATTTNRRRSTKVESGIGRKVEDQAGQTQQLNPSARAGNNFPRDFMGQYYTCLLYTSDAADEEDSVDLGGRRIIKKKKK